MNIFQQLCQQISNNQTPCWEEWETLREDQQRALFAVMREIDHTPTMVSYIHRHTTLIRWDTWVEECHVLPQGMSFDDVDEVYQTLLRDTPLHWGRFVDVVFNTIQSQGRADLMVWLLEHPDIECAPCRWNDERGGRLIVLIAQCIHNYQKNGYKEVLQDCIQECLDKPHIIGRHDLQERLGRVLEAALKNDGLPVAAIPLVDALSEQYRTPSLQAWRDKQDLMSHVSAPTLGRKIQKI